MRHLTEQILAFRDARDWKQFHGLKDEALSLLIEAGELAEHLRWHDDAALCAKVAADPQPVADGDELRAYLAGGPVVAVHEP